AALHDLAERVSGAAGIELEMHLSVGADRLDPELETAVYRLVQEALNNVAKHAGAGGVTLRVAEGDSRLDVVVADDGRGFDPAADHSGFGVAGMRERVELVGGELDIESVPGAGTRVMAAIPLA
ncbi:MAG TPA: ATP-binding protein, partial [Solirubrobacterales bacterium]|nr:ATP-binding protein [Solirubrobacterales bacterium]